MARSGNRSWERFWDFGQGGQSRASAGREAPRTQERGPTEADQKYALLGVARNAATAEINAAFRGKAKELHPDTDSGDAEKFKAISAARDILKDPVKRAMLDFASNTGRAYRDLEEQYARGGEIKKQIDELARVMEQERSERYKSQQAQQGVRQASPQAPPQDTGPNLTVMRRQAVADRQAELDEAHARRLAEQQAAREAEEAERAGPGAEKNAPEPAPTAEPESPTTEASIPEAAPAEVEQPVSTEEDAAIEPQRTPRRRRAADPAAEDMRERLGVGPRAKEVGIKKAYIRAGKKYGPHNAKTGDAEAMRRLNEAFDTLSGGKERAAAFKQERLERAEQERLRLRQEPIEVYGKKDTKVFNIERQPFNPDGMQRQVVSLMNGWDTELSRHGLWPLKGADVRKTWAEIEKERGAIMTRLDSYRTTTDDAERARLAAEVRDKVGILQAKYANRINTYIQGQLRKRRNPEAEISQPETEEEKLQRWADSEGEERTTKEERQRLLELIEKLEHTSAEEAERERLASMRENIELESQKEERWNEWDTEREADEESAEDAAAHSTSAGSTGAGVPPGGPPPPPPFGPPPPPFGPPAPPPGGAPKPKSPLQEAADRLKAARIAEDAAMERKDVAEAARFRAEAVTAREEVARLRAEAASTTFDVDKRIDTRREKLLAAEGVVQARDASYYRKKLFSRAAAWARGDNRGGPPEWEMNEAAAQYAGALEARLAAKLGADRDPEKKALSADFAARVADRYRRRMIHRDVIVRGEKAREAERARVLSEKEAGIVANGLQWAVRKNRELDQRYGWWWRGTRIAAFAALGAAPAAAGGAMAFAGAAGLRGLRGLAGFHFGTTVGTATGAGIGKAYERTLGKRSAERLAKSAGTEAKTSTDIEEMRAAYRAGNADAIARNRRNVGMAAALASGAGLSILAADWLGSAAPAHLPGAGHAPVPPPAHEALPATHTPPPAVAHPEHAPSTVPAPETSRPVEAPPSAPSGGMLPGEPAPGAHPTSPVPGSAAPTPEHPALPEHPAAPAAPPETAHPAPPVAEAPKVPSLSVEVRPGLGYEAMLKDMWRQLQGQHLDGANVPPGSDLAKLLAADAKHIDGLVHRMALDPSHGFARADGASAFVGRGAHLRLWPDGSVRFEDGAHAPTVHAPADARMVPPAAHAPQAAGINPDKSADYFNQQVEERLARGEPVIPPPAYTPLPEAPAHLAAHAGAAAHAPAPHAESPAPLPRAPHSAEPSLPAGERIPPSPSIAPGHPAFNGVIEPPPTHDDININHSAPGYLPGRSPLPHSIDAAAHVGAPESFVNAQGVPIDSVHGAVYWSGNGAPIAYAHDYATRLTLAQEYAKGHPGVAVWVQAEKPVAGADGTLRPWVESVTYRRGWFRSVFDITKAPTAPDQIAVVNPDTFVRQAYPPPAPATVVA